jgi:hypothetical protein
MNSVWDPNFTDCRTRHSMLIGHSRTIGQPTFRAGAGVRDARQTVHRAAGGHPHQSLPGLLVRGNVTTKLRVLEMMGKNNARTDGDRYRGGSLQNFPPRRW